MRTSIALIGILLLSLNSYSQTIPTLETTFRIQKKEIKQFDFSLPKGYTLKAIVRQMRIDLGISVYKKGDTSRLAYFDSPNGEYGPEPVTFESPAGGNYILVLEAIREDTASSGNFTIRQIAIRYIAAKHDTNFAHGSEIVINNLNPVKIDNLTNLGMIWGFLKYYHPSVAGGEYNWDASLFRIMPKILSAATKTEANTQLDCQADHRGHQKWKRSVTGEGYRNNK